jgi:predicted RNA-binding Zn-ribbon protein involved in translation (DUF1610 family)
MSTLRPVSGAGSDLCPQCGALVQATLTFKLGGGEQGSRLSEPDSQSKQCPGCGAQLRRIAGQAWRLDEVEPDT